MFGRVPTFVEIYEYVGTGEIYARKRKKMNHFLLGKVGQCGFDSIDAAFFRHDRSLDRLSNLQHIHSITPLHLNCIQNFLGGGKEFRRGGGRDDRIQDNPQGAKRYGEKYVSYDQSSPAKRDLTSGIRRTIFHANNDRVGSSAKGLAKGNASPEFNSRPRKGKDAG